MSKDTKRVHDSLSKTIFAILFVRSEFIINETFSS